MSENSPSQWEKELRYLLVKDCLPFSSLGCAHLQCQTCPACALGAVGARSGVGVSQGVSMRTQVWMLPPQQWTEETGETGVEGKRVKQKPSQEP